MMRMYNPPHPGEVLKDGVFTDGDITIKQFAEQIGVTRAALSRVLNGRAAISPEMALRLADALGGSAESWLHMQANYDLWQARQKPRIPIARIDIRV
jgi:addiction module HigA family antidote